MSNVSRRAFLALALAAGITPALAEDPWKIITPPPPLPKPDERGLVPIDDIQMYYEIYNAASPDPVLLLHGGLGSTLNFGNQVPELMKSHRVIAIDSRGHGRSTRTAKPYSYELMEADTLAMMDHLKLDKVAVVGWSDGAIIGLLMAIGHPERVAKLFAYGANYNVAGLNQDFESNPIVGKVFEIVTADYQKLSPTPGAFEDFAKQIGVMWQTQPNIKPEQLAKITVPTVIADGQYEEAIYPAHTAELAKLIPGARLVILPNVGHMGLWQDPEAFNAAVKAFLAGS